ncbi:MAG TPA: hypothetical protein VE055_05945, partial [Gaiellaceae bacterium]|nr:hypothetical protein [Gaiellaceae bacterium]
AALLLVAVCAGCGSSGGSGRTFSADVTNEWFPLRPGSVYHYRGVKDGEPSREVMTVTDRTRTIDGARCVVVADLLYLRGVLEERTRDYYTQDADGNVWYFGEDTAELDEHGRVKTREGTWHAGVDGAKPGIFMYAHPRVGQSARQEYLKGQAEDHFHVLRRGVGVTVPFKPFSGALLTKEWTPLEPGVIDHKYYARGIGTVLEQTVRGGDERNQLVSFSRG